MDRGGKGGIGGGGEEGGADNGADPGHFHLTVQVCSQVSASIYAPVGTNNQWT